MQHLGVNHWETYGLVVNWIRARLLLAIESIHELTTRPIDFVLEFTKADLDVDVFMEIPLGAVVFQIRE